MIDMDLAGGMVPTTAITDDVLPVTLQRTMP